MKKIILKNSTEVAAYTDIILDAADAAQRHMLALAGTRNGTQLLEAMKFEKIGYDPLDIGRELNLVEQINQSFTYLASFRAAEILFQRHRGISELSLNLGMMAGSDIESSGAGGIAAEVFAATRPKSNRKLSKDTAKVVATDATHKYVFFMCPGIEAGPHKEGSTGDILVWSLGVRNMASRCTD
jgi:hypothetical protein